MDEIKTYRLLDDPTRLLWGLSIRTLGTLATTLLLVVGVMKLGILPPKWVLTFGMLVGSLAATFVWAAETQGIHPGRELIGRLRQILMAGVDQLHGEPWGGVLLTDLPEQTDEPARRAPVIDEDWTSPLATSSEHGAPR